MSDHDALTTANARFYRAFETLDLRQMERVWSHGEHVRCVHPGWPLLVGWPAVRASWETIFANTVEMSFTLSSVDVVAGAELGWITCAENILSEVRGRVTVTSLLATNVFERDVDRWLLVHHHASHVLGHGSG